MEEKAVIDRFEGEKAVLLAGEEQRVVIVPRKDLPAGAREGHWLKLRLEGQSVVGIDADEEGTAKARQRIADKLDRLRRLH